MTQQELTSRQAEMLHIMEEKVENDEGKILLKKARLGTLSLDEIAEVCLLINDEYLMKGIKEDWEPNDHGKELYQLLCVINEPRLQYSAEEFEQIQQSASHA